MIEHGVLDQFLANWQAINRNMRKGVLTGGNEGITRLQWMLLRHVSRNETSTIGNLAEKFGVSPSTISQMADRLEKNGLIQRISDTKDARIKLVSLTEKGQELIHNIESAWARRLSEGLSQLSGDEQDNLLKLLEHLAASMVDPT